MSWLIFALALGEKVILTLLAALSVESIWSVLIHSIFSAFPLSASPFRSYIHIRPALCIILSPSGCNMPSIVSFSVLRSPSESRKLSPLTAMSLSFRAVLAPFRRLLIMLVSMLV